MGKGPDIPNPTVFVVDDDVHVREAVRGLFDSVGLSTETFGSVQEYSLADRPDRAGCLVLDVRLPGESGLEFQETLARTGRRRSVVLMSAHLDVAMSVRAMKAGAVDVLLKPVREQDLLEAVHRAIAQDASCRSEAQRLAGIRERYSRLSGRERQTMALVVAGLQNKEIAAEAKIALPTVKLHRGRVMTKMEADSLPSLVRMADLLKLDR